MFAMRTPKLLFLMIGLSLTVPAFAADGDRFELPIAVKTARQRPDRRCLAKIHSAPVDRHQRGLQGRHAA
jgi:hypothetical protein